MKSTVYNPFETARQQFDHAADLLELDNTTRELLRTPMREYHFNIPVRMDDGTKKIFRGFRIQHNDARGPAKGGVRFHPLETIDTVRALSMWMSWKTAVADIPLGGGKGGVICDPHHLSNSEQEQLCRGWVRQIVRNLGPNIDIPSPDIMTNAQHMLWMLDEYETIMGGHFPGFITGKPTGLGGSLGKKESTGYGVIIAIREALNELGLKAANTVASVQGYGNVARYAIELYQKMGGKVICVSCWDEEDHKTCAFRKKDGIITEELDSISDVFGGIDKHKARDMGYELFSGNEWLSQEVDILIPAALENQITMDNVNNIRDSVKLIAEGANGPVSPDADKILADKGIFMIPDFLANAGGAISSYFEQVQSNMNYYWEKDEVLGKLDVKMTSAYAAVSDFAKENKLSMRDSAYVISIDRVAQACRERGWV